jgi:hypothetical protein
MDRSVIHDLQPAGRWPWSSRSTDELPGWGFLPYNFAPTYVSSRLLSEPLSSSDDQSCGIR